MKPRVLVTQKILAVAVVAAAGCAAPTPHPESPAALVDVPHATQASPPAAATPAAAMQPSAVPAASAPPPAPSPPAAAMDRSKTAGLPALQSELFKLSEREAIQHVAHFRPLCDDKGFPVVGNMYRKAPGYEVSEFCALVRTTGKK